jgi:hypothetical protein
VLRLSSFRALAIAIVVAACAPVPAVSPAATLSAQATAPAVSPSVDLPAALRAILRAPGPYRMRMDRTQTSETTTSHIVGTMRVTPDAWAAEGTRTDQATGSSMVAEATYEMVWIGDSGYTRSDEGPWIPFVGLFDHPLRLTAEPDAGELVETGRVVEDGETLFRLGYADPGVIDPVFVLAIGNELDQVDAAVTYDLTADGRLVRMRSTLSGQRQARFGGGSIAHEAEYTVIPGFPEQIGAPPTDWALYRSPTLPLAFALPPGWSADGAADGVERFRGRDGVARIGVRQDPSTDGGGALVDEIRSEYRALGIGEPGSVVPTYLGSEVATAVIYPNVDLGSGVVNVVHLVSAFDGVAYDIVWTMQAGILQRQYDMIGDVATSWHWGATGS